jgi:DNA-directed RNA polymerase subunit beta'
VQELFEARSPKGEAIVSDIDGVAEIIHQDGLRRIRVVSSEVFKDKYDIKYGWKILVEGGDDLEAGAPLASRGKREIVATTGGRVSLKDRQVVIHYDRRKGKYDIKHNWKILVREGAAVEAGTPLASRGEHEIVAKTGGKVSLEERQIVIRYERREEREYEVPSAARLLVENGQKVVAGQQLTEGSLNPHRILRILGREATQSYLLEEIQKVYRSQGVNINDKHIEMIIRQMLKKVGVVSPGDTTFLLGELVDRLVFADVNAKIAMAGEQPATAQPVLLGITKSALKTDSFLSAASFQHTINVLAEAAVEGKTDELLGLKENVIIGKLIPAGTGFRDREKTHLAARTKEGKNMEAEEERIPEKV